jgi:hypothetical protein
MPGHHSSLKVHINKPLLPLKDFSEKFDAAGMPVPFPLCSVQIIEY